MVFCKFDFIRKISIYNGNNFLLFAPEKTKVLCFAETLAMQKPVQNGNRTQLQEQLRDLQSITQVYCEQFRDAKEVRCLL